MSSCCYRPTCDAGYCSWKLIVVLQTKVFFIFRTRTAKFIVAKITVLKCRPILCFIPPIKQWRVQRGPRRAQACTQTQDRLKKSCENYCCRRESVFRLSTLSMMKFVTYSSPGKMMFSALFCRDSSAFEWATVSLECHTGQAYWRSGPGRITAQKQVLVLAGECTKIMHFETKECPPWGTPTSGPYPPRYTLDAYGASIPKSKSVSGPAYLSCMF